MQFFDFNIPYLEDPPAAKTTPSERAARKKSRLKLVVKAVELGYSGIAYNRSIKGALSDSDRCSISLFPLSSLLSLSPSLSSSAAFHRRLLSGPRAAPSPFRQYTRITVSVDNPSQSSALNSGNAILKSYDLVAVRPMNQVAFDQACQFSEVDLIAIDFSDKMPFRLKLPMVKAAITRGVYFEITYSGLIEDIHVRRQVISHAKLLVDWTRGRNLIVSSAAPSVLEFRGPNDIANLLSLLGLATEHAKASISKNCRSLIANTLKKKQFYKGAVKVDRMPSIVQTDPKKPWIVDSMEWDPISSGEGDLLLEDLAKSFSEASKKSETLKPNAFASSMNNIASDGLMVTNLGAEIKEFDDANTSIAAVKEPTASSETEKIRFYSQRKPMSLFSIPPDHHRDVSSISLKPLLSGSESVITCSVNTVHSSTASEAKLKCSDVPDMSFATAMMPEAQTSIFSQKSNIMNTDSILQKCSDVPDMSFATAMLPEAQTSMFSQKSNIMNTDSILQKCKDAEAGTTKQNDTEVSAQSNSVTVVSETTLSMMVVDANTDSNLEHVTGFSPTTKMDLTDQSNPSLISSGCLIEEALEVKECEENNKEVFLHAHNMVDLDSGDEGKDGDHLLVRCPAANAVLPVEEKRHKEVECCIQETDMYLSTNSDGTSDMNSSERISSSSDLLIHHHMYHGDDMRLQVQAETEAKPNYISKTATKAVKRRLQQRGFIRFPFKRLLQVPFKRKAVASRHKSRKR